MEDLLRTEETDSLAALEERILRAVEMVSTLREEKQALQKELEDALEAKESARRDADHARADLTRLNEELASLQSERKQVRTRIEKLLGQMDLLSST